MTPPLDGTHDFIEVLRTFLPDLANRVPVVDANDLLYALLMTVLEQHTRIVDLERQMRTLERAYETNDGDGR